MKKVFGINVLVVSLVLVLFSIGLVLSQTTGEVFFNNISEFTTNLLETLNLNQENLTILLLGILLWMVLHSVLKETDLFGGSPLVTGIISLISTVLAFLTLRNNSAFISLLSGNFAGLGGAVLTLLPFIIAFYFTMKVSKSVIMARAIWFIFFLYFFVNFLFVINYAGIDVFDFTFVRGAADGEISGGGAYYFWAGIASLIMLFLIPVIRGKWFDAFIESSEEKMKRNAEEVGAAVRGAKELGGALRS